VFIYNDLQILCWFNVFQKSLSPCRHNLHPLLSNNMFYVFKHIKFCSLGLWLVIWAMKIMIRVNCFRYLLHHSIFGYLQSVQLLSRPGKHWISLQREGEPQRDFDALPCLRQLSIKNKNFRSISQFFSCEIHRVKYFGCSCSFRFYYKNSETNCQNSCLKTFLN